MAVIKHTRVVAILSALVVGMFGFCFALVPMYNSICRALGVNGKPTPMVATDKARSVKPDLGRTIVVEFVATNHGGVPWDFYPKVHELRVHPGEINKLAFYAENRSGYRMTVQAIPSVTPGIAAKYIKKTECFCFTRQSLNGHEAMNMPLLFHVDMDLPSEIKRITLAYALFDVTDKT